jgi:hypothetical protein
MYLNQDDRTFGDWRDWPLAFISGALPVWLHLAVVAAVVASIVGVDWLL